MPSKSWRIRRRKQDIAAALTHLANGGFRRCSYLIEDRQGHAAPAVAGKSYFLSLFFEGRVADYGNAEDVTAAAALLATFHHHAEGLCIPAYPGRDKWGVWPEMIAKKRGELVQWGEEALWRPQRDRFDRLFLRHLPHYLEETDASLHRFAASRYDTIWREEAAQGGFCHHDLAHHNVLITSASPVLIDFDYAIADIRGHDIANFLLKILKENDWEEDLAAAALETYDRQNPLRSGELEVILAILRFPQDFWQVGLARYGENIVPHDRCESKLERWTREKTLRCRGLSRLEAHL